MPAERFSELVYRLSWAGCLLGFAATLYLPAAWTGYVNHWLLNGAIAAAATIFAALFCLVIFARLPSQTNRLGVALWLAILAIVVLEVVLSLVPATARDELTSHLRLPDVLYAPWAGWGWRSVPKLIHGLYSFLTGLLLCAYLAHRLNVVYGLLGLLFYISTPVVFQLSHLATVDLGLAYYVTASLLCVLFWAEDTKQSRWLVLAGASAGFAMATGPNGLAAFLFLALALGYAAASQKEIELPQRLLPLGLCVFCALAVFSPWAATNAALPLKIVFTGADDPARYLDGALNPLLILFLPWAFKGKRREEKRIFFGFALAYFLLALFLGELRSRDLLPAVPPLVILLVYAIHNIYLRIVHPKWLFAILILLTALNGIYLWNSFN
ncbi:MAG: hypothetical protein A3F90_19760 [Deltaproteobacteria bacterium RIFCSPLOWO2_12_FULL_60_19]|nr:MAG: hypothetical protein A3F90_19760 [Deltaproteobacteria bacterium RIFCSPLOWO2_12_FULL_60_19]